MTTMLGVGSLFVFKNKCQRFNDVSHLNPRTYWIIPPLVKHVSWEGQIYFHEAFFRMHLPLALEVYNGLFIDSLGFMAVDSIEKHLRVWGELRGTVSWCVCCVLGHFKNAPMGSSPSSGSNTNRSWDDLPQQKGLMVQTGPIWKTS